jgi:hypothetical protein
MLCLPFFVDLLLSISSQNIMNGGIGWRRQSIIHQMCSFTLNVIEKMECISWLKFMIAFLSYNPLIVYVITLFQYVLLSWPFLQLSVKTEYPKDTK